jgi:hypothetical protein
MMTTIVEVRTRLASLVGKPCSAKWVGEYKSLAMGFGRDFPKPTSRNPLAVQYEWEMGTYTAAWRVVKDKKVVCGSMDLVDGNAELDNKLQELNLGSVVRIEMISGFDIRVVLTGQSCVEFICASSDDDEIFHISGPDHFFAKYSFAGGWVID